MKDECTCPCHESGIMMHIAPCCMFCDYCGKHIQLGSWQKHISQCGRNNQIWDGQIEVTMADVETILVSALSFYAEESNWEGEWSKAVADCGEIARMALLKVEGDHVRTK